MSLQYSPRIVQDSLVMCIDPSQNKSYPTDLPVKDGLVMWMDASDDTTFSYSSGTTVTQWRDKSTSGFHMTPKSGGPTRSSVLNSRKVLAFTTSQTIGNNTINLASSANTVFVVSRLTGTTNGRVLTCNLDANGNNWLLGHHGGTYNDYFAEGWVTNGGSLDTNWRMYMGDWSGTSTDLANFYSNGTAITTNSTAASQGPNKLGVNYYSNELSTCEVAEIIVYNKVLSTRERNLIHTYLGQKWGISNADRQIFDLSGNNFNFSFNGTNPRYNAKSIVSNFDATSPFAVSSFGGQNLTSNILNLLYADHTIEVAFNAKGFQSVYNYDNSLTTQNGQSIVIWTGRHSGLRVYQNTIIYEYWNSQSSTVGISVNISSYQDKIMYITATKTGDTLRLYINGVLASGPTTVAATTSPVSYSQINIGAAYQGNPTTQGYIWASQHEYHLLRMYSRQLSDIEVSSNYQSFKARFDNNIVRFGLVMELDASNPYSYAGTGTTWFDVSGTGNNGTLTNGPTYSKNNNGVITLDGIDDYITCANNTSLQITSALTLEIWFYNTAAVDGLGMIVKGPLSSDYDYMLYLSGNSTTAYFYKKDSGGGIHYGGTTLSLLNRWLHIVVTHTSGGVYTMYANGVAIDSAGFSNSTIRSTSNPLFIGAGWNPDYFYGNIGETRIYNVALSAAQVLQNYNATKGRYGL